MILAKAQKNCVSGPINLTNHWLNGDGLNHTVRPAGCYRRREEMYKHETKQVDAQEGELSHMEFGVSVFSDLLLEKSGFGCFSSVACSAGRRRAMSCEHGRPHLAFKGLLSGSDRNPPDFGLLFVDGHLSGTQKCQTIRQPTRVYHLTMTHPWQLGHVSRGAGVFSRPVEVRVQFCGARAQPGAQANSRNRWDARIHFWEETGMVLARDSCCGCISQKKEKKHLVAVVFFGGWKPGSPIWLNVKIGWGKSGS